MFSVVIKASSLALVAAAVLLAGCSTMPEERPSNGQSSLRQIFRPDFSAREPRRFGFRQDEAKAGGSGRQMASASTIFGGDNALGIDQTVTGQTPLAGGDGVQLNFQDAALAEFIDAILGDALQVNYTIDPNVSGSVTLSTAEPLDRDGLLEVLEAILKSQRSGT